MIAIDASSSFSPVNVRLYWIAALMKAIRKMYGSVSRGGGLTNQISTSAVTLKRKHISRIGGN